jgi:hypothetical protein
MEVDHNVPGFLTAQREKAPANLKPFFFQFEDFYQRKYSIVFSYVLDYGIN